jgi:hypothetical protein
VAGDASTSGAIARSDRARRCARFEDAYAVAARKLVREKKPTAVIAHHVEAAALR